MGSYVSSTRPPPLRGIHPRLSVQQDSEEGWGYGPQRTMCKRMYVKASGVMSSVRRGGSLIRVDERRRASDARDEKSRRVAPEARCSDDLMRACVRPHRTLFFSPTKLKTSTISGHGAYTEHRELPRHYASDSLLSSDKRDLPACASEGTHTRGVGIRHGARRGRAGAVAHAA